MKLKGRRLAKFAAESSALKVGTPELLIMRMQDGQRQPVLC